MQLLPDQLRLNQWLSVLKRELQWSCLLPNLLAGLLCGIIEITFAASLASLIFAVALPDYVSAGISLGLVTVTIVSMVTALTSSLPGTIAIPDEVPAAILALMVQTIATQMPADIPPQVRLATVLAAIAFTTVLTGLSFFLLGFFKLGNLIRFIPYPVVGGFLASTGWLLVMGAIGFLTNTHVELAQLASLFTPLLLLRWLPATLFAIVLLAILRRYDHFLIIPTLLLVGIVLFYLTLWILGVSPEQATEQGFLLQPTTATAAGQSLSWSTLVQADWQLILSQLKQQVTLILLSVLSLLVNASGLEVLIGRSLDFNRELRVAGVANLLSGFGGGVVGFHSISSSALSYRVGTGSAAVGIILSLFCAIALLVGTSLITLVPKVVLGGLLLFLGLELLWEWVYDAWFKLPTLDYGLVLLILVINSTVGLLAGIAVGLVAAVVLFVLNYSRIRVTRYALSGATYHSHAARSLPQQRLLAAEGEQIYILDLQGFLFFGTANTLFEQLRQRIQATDLPTLHYVLLNFRLVTGLDSSAVLSFLKLKQIARQQQFVLIYGAFADDAAATGARQLSRARRRSLSGVCGSRSGVAMVRRPDPSPRFLGVASDRLPLACNSKIYSPTPITPRFSWIIW
ncbi:MAG: SulP family inorganic anion transporter, partial [Leptolyngbyaceae cyanobacterium SL_7_1]|nr:SulP family inorganic anion transporter [Leptolyngbyaceae cyanobacterium SL_7_1]